MFHLVSTVSLLLVFVNGDSPARRLNPLVTKRPTTPYTPRMVKSDRYTSRPTPPYTKAMKSDGYFGFLRRFTKRPTSRYNVAARSDRYTSRPTPPYVKGDGYRLTRRPTSPYAAKSDGFTRYFRRFSTKRPTSRYNGAARSDLRTRRPTSRRYGVQGDLKTQRPTSRKYGVDARNDAVTQRPTRQKYTAEKFERVEAKNEEKVEPAGKSSNGAQQMVPEAEVMDKKYFYVKNRLGWNDAQEACARRGAQLATIHSMSEHERVGKACQGECWIGADRSDVAASFTWSDDSAMDFEKWAQPQEEPGLCAKMSKSVGKEWMHADCDDKVGFVCQKMDWNAQLKASVESDSLSFAATFAQGNILSIAVMVVVVIVVGFLGLSHVCMVTNDKKCCMFGKQGANRTDGTSDETTPLLWTRA